MTTLECKISRFFFFILKLSSLGGRNFNNFKKKNFFDGINLY
nr:MAG TPA: hypothetical protein [Caudoviricetes sp.]